MTGLSWRLQPPHSAVMRSRVAEITNICAMSHARPAARAQVGRAGAQQAGLNSILQTRGVPAQMITHEGRFVDGNGLHRHDLDPSRRAALSQATPLSIANRTSSAEERTPSF